jgi:transcriptional regulator with XRE-family HTH domain
MDNAKVGQRIRSFREKAELTLNDLAARTGLDEPFLKAIEDEDCYPSLQPLVKIARALGVRLGTFLDDQVSSDPLVVRKAERKEEMVMHPEGREEASHRFHSLGRGKSDRNMEPFVIEMQPEEGERKLSSHEGEEFILVQSGRMEIVYGEKRAVLEPGDSAYFNSIVPHYVGATEGPATIFAVLYFPH